MKTLKCFFVAMSLIPVYAVAAIIIIGLFIVESGRIPTIEME